MLTREAREYMSRYLNHSRHMDYTKNMAEHIYLTEKMKPTDKQKKFLYALRKKCEENGISTETDRELKTRLMVDLNCCMNYIQNYLKWLNDKFIIECESEKFCRVVTPFLRPDNDNIEVFIEKYNDYIVLTDDGSTFEYLLLSGLDLDRAHKKDNFITGINNRTGTVFEDYEIKSYIETFDEFGVRFNNFINAIFSFCNMTYMIQQRDKRSVDL